MPQTIQHTQPTDSQAAPRKPQRRSPLSGVLGLPRPILVGGLVLAFSAAAASIYFSQFHVAPQPAVYQKEFAHDDKQWLAARVRETNGQVHALSPEDRARAEKITDGHATTYFAHYSSDGARNNTPGMGQIDPNKFQQQRTDAFVASHKR